jgi:UDP-N-acetylmuramoyl-tripeptide--D-alanyl-D-alanine ligase
MGMMSASEAAAAVGGRLHGHDVVFDSVATDTRTLTPGALFVALQGDRFDGHHFVAEAAQQGAVAALVHRAPGQDESFGVPYIIARDTRSALGQLAHHWRGKFAIPLVALTGSSGKTTVKEMLAGILRRACADDAAVLATRGNLNNDIGVPLMLLELNRTHRYAVLEMGMNHANEIRYLARLAVPDVALVNNAGRAHIEYLGTEEAIARAKGELYEELKPDGTAVINVDDRYADLWRSMSRGCKRVEFGIDHDAPVSAQYKLRYLESDIVVKTSAGNAAATLHAPGLHNVRNALAASAAAMALDISPTAIASGLASYTGIKGRLQQKRGRHGATLLDDTYNANPDSVRAAIALLAQAPGRRLLVLGDMGELGEAAQRFHAEAGEAARAAGIEGLYTLGKLSAHAAEAFGCGALHFAEIDALLRALEAGLQSDVTVLVKGSRFMRMERVVEALCPKGKMEMKA